MRKATQKLAELYKTQLGQDVIETLFGAGLGASYQALFTDLTPEQILMSTGVGIGAAAVGRPIVGRLGGMVGAQAAKRMPGKERQMQQLIAEMSQNPMIAAKFAPYAGTPAIGQMGNVLGRQYGDNVAQGLVTLAAPGLIPQEE
jgi:hypothetical protein